MNSELSCWVLHKQWSGDTSARVTFYTRERGIVCGLCKGGRTPKKQVLLQPFTPLWVLFNERSNYIYVNQLELISPTLSLKGHYLFAGLYINELLFHALRPLDSCSELYDAYVATLNALCCVSNDLDLQALLRRFEWTLLSTMGYSISFTHDARTHQPILPENQYVFIVEEGIVAAKQGIQGSYLLALAEGKLENPLVLKAAKIIMRAAMNHALGGKEIKTRNLYTSFNSTPHS
ncbi:MAG: DNA repair protein RecO [Legionellaceae bacterium]|nr:DNA repair protein RecO [Legionellaceae bacterium]